MGWNESPAFFCATTDMVRDVSQVWIDHRTELPAHKMEAYTEPAEPPRRQSTDGPIHQWSGVYVDDHIMAVVEDKAGTLLRRTARATLHAIHSVFASPDALTMEGAKDPISEKKLKKGTDAGTLKRRSLATYWMESRAQYSYTTRTGRRPH